MARVRSPKYPNYPLAAAIENIRKVYDADRTALLPREVIAKHLGYSGLSGASDTAIATLVQYGLLEKVSKGEMQVTSLAVDILVPETDAQKQAAINKAALSPQLFTEVNNHFEGRVPSPEALTTYLLRREFQDRAIKPILKSVSSTFEMIKKEIESESGGEPSQSSAESNLPADEIVHGSASIGDFIQWESQGALQFGTPQRVRWISDDGDWVAVEGSDTGIPMNEITVEQHAHTPPKMPPIPPAPQLEERTVEKGFSEWFRAKVGADKLITINYKGADDIGPREIEKMITILEAQKLALED